MKTQEQKMNEQPAFLSNLGPCSPGQSNLGLYDVGYCYWFGASGRKYVHSVYRLDAWPGHVDANIMLIRNCPTDGRQILWAGQAGRIPGQLSKQGILSWARANGANEVHVHLLGGSAILRDQITKDLQRIARIGSAGLVRDISFADSGSV
jgi:hypothetical protein